MRKRTEPRIYGALHFSETCKGNYTASSPRTGVTTMNKLHFDRTDYSVVVKNRAPPPSSWKWEIYRAGRSSPVKQSSVFFHTIRKRGAQAAIGQAPCKPSRLSGF